MVSCAELAKRIDALESKLKSSLDAFVEEAVAKLKQKMDDLGAPDSLQLAKSVEFVSDDYDSLKAKYAEVVEANKILTARNKALEERMADLEQYSRLNNIEIKGVPVTKGEDCGAILKSVAEALECPIEASDIDTIHRVPAFSGEKNIIARFCSRDKKNEFIRRARKARLRANQIGFSKECDSPVYLNDHLTMANKKLFAKALALKKEKKWQFLWTENCQIKARWNEESKVFRIATESDLKIFA